MTIIVQDDYWTGSKCVENEVPWQTPGSIYPLDFLCRPTDVVLEIGTGGSTLFYARRCKSVFAIETNPAWHDTMTKTIKGRGITNILSVLAESQDAVEWAISHLDDEFSIASVDSVHGFDRSAFLRGVLARGEHLQTIVLDNYGEKVLFPDHFDKTPEQMIELCPGTGWRCMDFDDSHWCGRGTRILTRRAQA